MLSLHQLALEALNEDCEERLRTIIQRSWEPQDAVAELYDEMLSRVIQGALPEVVEDQWDARVGYAERLLAERLEALREDFEERLQELMQISWEPRAAVRELYAEMTAREGSLPQVVIDQRDEWMDRAEWHLEERCNDRLQEIVQKNYPFWGPHAAVDELYAEMIAQVGVLQPDVEGRWGAWLNRAYTFLCKCCDDHIATVVAQNYPVWGWRDAEAVADKMYDELSVTADITVTGERRQILLRRLRSQFPINDRDEWINRTHRLYSFETCIRDLAYDASFFIRAWWTASLGVWNAVLPNPSYHCAQVRGAYLYRVHQRPTPRVVSPPQGHAVILDPTEYGAPWHQAFHPQGCAASLSDWLNECELRFLFAIAYMKYGAIDLPWQEDRDERYERSERMISTLLELVQRRMRGELDTRAPAVMGRRWANSYVTMLMLRTRPGEQLVAPLTEL